jgi:hypothetical protein
MEILQFERINKNYKKNSGSAPRPGIFKIVQFTSVEIFITGNGYNIFPPFHQNRTTRGIL